MTWFIKFWLISSVVSLIIVLLTSYSAIADIKRNYDIDKDKIGKFNLAQRIRSSLFAFVPFLNVIICIIYIFGYDKIRDGVIENYKTNGYISKKR